VKSVLALAKAMSDPNRLRVLGVLRGRELCACDIIEMLGLAQATVSRHMSLLVQAGLVIGRKQGRWMYYRLPEIKDNPASEVIDVLKWVHDYAMNVPQIQTDEKLIKAHMKGKPVNALVDIEAGACGFRTN
jgi:DNA-binding transcriptional ArsR family regulator